MMSAYDQINQDVMQNEIKILLGYNSKANDWFF